LITTAARVAMDGFPTEWTPSARSAEVTTSRTHLTKHMVGTFNPHNVYACYAMAKYFAGKECGGAVTQRADLPRVWDVPVGAEIE
jgi:hypothetical protein